MHPLPGAELPFAPAAGVPGTTGVPGARTGTPAEAARVSGAHGTGLPGDLQPPVIPQTPEDDILWYSCSDGTLTAFDGKRNLIALPAEGVHTPRGAESTVRWIDGKEYIIFAK